MNLPTYDVKLKSEISNTFEFFSEGKNGKIQKVVVFQKIADGIFNLAFGDKIEETGT